MTVIPAQGFLAGHCSFGYGLYTMFSGRSLRLLVPTTCPGRSTSRRTDPDHSGAGGTIRALTLIELLVVITIILVLAGLAIPGIGVVREGTRKQTATTVVSTLLQAIQAYRQDDHQRRLPSQPNADRSLSRREVDDARSAPGTLELLENVGLSSASEQPRDADGRLLDPWGNPYRYHATMIRTEVVPDGQLTDWNWDPAQNRPAAWGRRPDPATQAIADGALLFAYIWSTGKAGPEGPIDGWIYPADGSR